MVDLGMIARQVREDVERMDREYEATKKTKEKRESVPVTKGTENGKLDGADGR